MEYLKDLFFLRQGLSVSLPSTITTLQTELFH